MSKSKLDLSTLPEPKVIEELSVENLLELRKQKMLELNPAYEVALRSNTDPLLIDMEVSAYREYLLRHRINNVAQARLLAKATGADLDHIGDFYGIARKDDNEEDESYRMRIRGRVTGSSTAGSKDQYETKAMEVHPSAVRDIAVDSPEGGRVRISVLCNERYCYKQKNKFTALNDFKCTDFCKHDKSIPERHSGECPDVDNQIKIIIEDISQHISSNSVRMLTDTVSVIKAEEIIIDIKAKITLIPGIPDSVCENIKTHFLTCWDNESSLGWDLTPSWINSRLYQTGVHQIDLESPKSIVKVLPHQNVRWGKVELIIDGRTY